MNTKLRGSSKLPLTCSRAGTCCHGNQVFLNAFELAYLAQESNVSPQAFRDVHCDLGGIRLRFNGKEDKRGKPACSQYIEHFGCGVHTGRPLACRLFPLGRQLQHGTAEYIFEGTTFPCLNGCPEVVHLPELTVDDYLKGQQTAAFEKAQDAYLEIMQNIADLAFTFFLDTGLAASGDSTTLEKWRQIGNASTADLLKGIDPFWVDLLTIPTISTHDLDPIAFAEAHNELIQANVQEKFGTLASYHDCHLASVEMMGLSLYLARALGANPSELAELWIVDAKSFGEHDAEV